MARSPIEIPIASETRAFKTGVESGIIEPLEDAEKALEELGRSRGPEQLERGMEDAQRETKDFKQEIDDTRRGLERMAASARNVGDDAKRGMGDAKAAAQEVTQEVGSNLGEAVSSIRGDLSDLGQVGQDTLGGLAATLAGTGPAGIVGAAALAAGAVGLGLVTAGLEDTAEKQERLKEQAAEWAQAYIEAGSSILTTTQIVAKGQEIFGDPEEYEEARKKAKLWGVEVSTAVAALSGSQSAIDLVSDALDRQEAALEANAAGADNYAQNIEQATTGQSQANSSYLEGKRALDDLNGSMELGKEQAGYWAQMLTDVYRSAEGATEKVDEFGDTIIELPDGKKLYIDAETGQATEDADAIQKKIYGLQGKELPVTVNPIDNVTKMLDGLTRTRRTVNVDVNYRTPGTAWY